MMNLLATNRSPSTPSRCLHEINRQVRRMEHSYENDSVYNKLEAADGRGRETSDFSFLDLLLVLLALLGGGEGGDCD